ncbi:MAG: hypothetical protein ACTSUE_07000 [Promethearchaeota archaeon]
MRPAQFGNIAMLESSRLNRRNQLADDKSWIGDDQSGFTDTTGVVPKYAPSPTFASTPKTNSGSNITPKPKRLEVKKNHSSLLNGVLRDRKPPERQNYSNAKPKNQNPPPSPPGSKARNKRLEAVVGKPRKRIPPPRPRRPGLRAINEQIVAQDDDTITTNDDDYQHDNEGGYESGASEIHTVMDAATKERNAPHEKPSILTTVGKTSINFHGDPEDRVEKKFKASAENKGKKYREYFDKLFTQDVKYMDFKKCWYLRSTFLSGFEMTHREGKWEQSGFLDCKKTVHDDRVSHIEKLYLDACIGICTIHNCDVGLLMVTASAVDTFKIVFTGKSIITELVVIGGKKLVILDFGPETEVYNPTTHSDNIYIVQHETSIIRGARIGFPMIHEMTPEEKKNMKLLNAQENPEDFNDTNPKSTQPQKSRFGFFSNLGYPKFRPPIRPLIRPQFTGCGAIFNKREPSPFPKKDPEPPTKEELETLEQYDDLQKEYKHYDNGEVVEHGYDDEEGYDADRHSEPSFKNAPPPPARPIDIKNMTDAEKNDLYNALNEDWNQHQQNGGGDYDTNTTGSNEQLVQT